MGRPPDDQRSADVLHGKVSYQASPSNRFIFFYRQHSTNRRASDELVAYESREAEDVNERPRAKVEWEGVRGNSLIANLQFGHSPQIRGSPFLDDPQIVGRSDLETERVTGDELVMSGRPAYAYARITPSAR